MAVAGFRGRHWTFAPARARPAVAVMAAGGGRDAGQREARGRGRKKTERDGATGVGFRVPLADGDTGRREAGVG